MNPLEHSPVMKDGKALILAYDHGLEHGPTDFEELEGSEDPSRVFEIAEHDAITALAVQKGLVEKYGDEMPADTALIVKANGNSSMWDTEPYSPKTCSVEYAVEELEADAIGYTVYAGSNREDEIFEDFRKVQEKAREYGVPLIVWAYPRGSNIGDGSHPSVIKYGARIGLELGADMVKTKYPGSEEAMKDVVDIAGKTKVVMSGGDKVTDDEFVEKVEHTLSAGADGIAVGRNVFQRDDYDRLLDRLQKTIFD